MRGLDDAQSINETHDQTPAAEDYNKDSPGIMNETIAPPIVTIATSPLSNLGKL